MPKKPSAKKKATAKRTTKKTATRKPAAKKAAPRKVAVKRAPAKRANEPWGTNVLVEFENGIAWVTLNRPDKRNAMSPGLNREMVAVVDALEIDPRCQVLVLTGAGTAFSAGMDLREYFREMDAADHIAVGRAQREAEEWQWRRMSVFPKPTIAMVNGWCFGGAFAPLVGCDLAIAADDAVFGLSEINWGIIPAGNVTKAVADTMNMRDAMYYVMTGETFNGKEAARLGLVNSSVPKRSLKKATRDLAKLLMQKNPVTMMQAKLAFRRCRSMDWETSADYLHAKGDQLKVLDDTDGRAQGLTQFLDKKTFRPGLGHYQKA